MSYTDYLASRGYRRVTVWRSTIDGVAEAKEAQRVPDAHAVVPIRRQVGAK
jgi:hypothetical protein